jgi:hypothetical protein
VITGEGISSPPWNVTAVQRNGSRVEVSWQPPMHPNGVIYGYDVFMTPPIPPVLIHSELKTFVIIDEAFEAGTN